MPPDEMADMSVEDLLNFRNRIERVIAQRVEAEKKDLIARLEALRQLEADANSPPSKSRRRGEATPKYWNPATGETWAGRGAQPRWMREAIKAGRKQEDFLIKP